MSYTLVKVTDLNGNTVHSFTTPWTAAVRAGGIRGNTAPAEAALMERAGSRGPTAGGKRVGERKLLVDYWVPVDASHESNLAALEAAYSAHTDTARTDTLYLVVSEDGVEKRGLCTLDKLAPSDQQQGNRQGHFIGMITLLDSVLQATSTTTETETLNSGNTTLECVQAGTVPSEYATITLKATAQKAAASGQRWLAYFTPIWRNPWPMVAWPTDVTNGGLDHAALVTATKSHSSGNDLELYENGRRVSLWLNGVNTATCKVWGNVNLQAARYWTHRGSGTIGSGDLTLAVEESLDNLPSLPFYAVLDGSTKECVRVTAANQQTRTLTIVRSQRGTTAPATHTAGTVLYWVSTTYDILCGYTSAAAPDYIEDKREPMINRGSSSNTAHTWSDYQQTGASADTQRRYPRPASWGTLDWIDRGDDSNRFCNTIPRTLDYLSDTDPADAMVIEYRQQGAFTGHPLQSAWGIRTPVGITSVAFTYNVKIEAPATYPYSGGVAREGSLGVRSVDRDGNVTLEAEYENTAGGGPLTGSDTVTLAATGYGVQFLYIPWSRRAKGGTSPQEPDDGDGVKITAVTLNYASSTLPGWITTAAANVVACYQYGRPDSPATLANTLGDSLELRGLYALLDTDLTIDVYNGTITNAAGIGLGHLRGGRYPRIPPGTTDLTLTDPGIGTITATAVYRGTWN